MRFAQNTPYTDMSGVRTGITVVYFDEADRKYIQSRAGRGTTIASRAEVLLVFASSVLVSDWYRNFDWCDALVAVAIQLADDAHRYDAFGGVVGDSAVGGTLMSILAASPIFSVTLFAARK